MGPATFLAFSGGGETGNQSDRPILKGLCIEDQAERGSEGKLETDIPEYLWIDDGHPCGGE